MVAHLFLLKFMPAANKISSVEFQRELMKRRTESQVQAEITAYLRKSGRPYTITDATVSLNAKGQRVMRVAEGWPDITTVTMDGQATLFAIECKRPYGGILRYEQAVCLKHLWSCGALVCIARSIEDVILLDSLNLTLQQRNIHLPEIERAIAKGPKPKKRSFKARRL